MPAKQAQAADQVGDRKYMVFREWDTMDTQSARPALDPRRPAWLENLQPVGKNDLLIVPGPGPSIHDLASTDQVSKMFYGNYNENDYLIIFTKAGAAYQTDIASSVTILFAQPGTFRDPDVTQWRSERILIADPVAGYATWDGVALVVQGGVSPNIVITDPGSGYVTPPPVVISGGSGSGAAAVAETVGNRVSRIVLTNPGVGYEDTDVITVTIGIPGTGATATAVPWPFLSFPVTTVAVFQSRVWLAGGRILQWTGTGGYDDVNPANAAGSTVLPDADLVHEITALRSLNNYLYIFGDNSIKQIGTIAVSGSVTLFTITTLTSDQGTTFPLSITSFNRLVVFANTVGVWAVYGASVEKISGPMDGLFRKLDFVQSLVSCSVDLNNVRVYMLLARYRDSAAGVTRSIFLSFFDKKWFIINQGSDVAAVVTTPRGSVEQAFSSSGLDVTQLLADNTRAVPVILQTALADSNAPMINKRALRLGVFQSTENISTMNITSDSENGSIPQTYATGTPIQWVNNSLQNVYFVNNLSQIIIWIGAGFQWRDLQGYATGIYLGATLTGTFVGYRLHNVVIEYEDSTLMRSRNSG